MNRKTVAAAVKEAREFIRRAEAWEKEGVSSVGEYVYASRKGGDLRRQSMELTRALTEMRKP